MNPADVFIVSNLSISAPIYALPEDRQLNIVMRAS